MTDDGTRIFTWNGENRLVSVAPKIPVDGGEKAEFIYDYMGRRVKKSVYLYDSGKSPAWQLEKYILFVYDGWNLIREITVDSGAESSRYFVWGQDLSGTLHGAGGVGGLLASVDNSGTAYSYLYDANGNVTQVVKSTDGSVAAHYEYDPYGNLTSSHGEYAAGNPFRFSTKYKDNETGLVYYGFRDYDPELGRWVSRDPIEEQGGLSLYSFISQNPINSIDYLGLKWSDKDYLDFYYANTNSNTIISLNETGLLDEFKNSDQIKEKISTVFSLYKNELVDRLKQKCKNSSNCIVREKFDVHDHDQSYNFKWYFSSTLKIMGKGSLYNMGFCEGTMDCKKNKWSGLCSLHFYVRDRFKDPWDYFDWIPGDYETGTPYKLYADWIQRKEWNY